MNNVIDFSNVFVLLFSTAHFHVSMIRKFSVMIDG